MLSDSEKKLIETYLGNIAKAERQRQELSSTIDRLDAVIRGILALVEDEKEVSKYLARLDASRQPTGFTDAVRRVLRGAGRRGLTPKETRVKLAELGIDISGQANPMASIHTVLKRLVDSSEAKVAIRDVNEGTDESVYQWVERHPIDRLTIRKTKVASLPWLKYQQKDKQ